jgi:hypothetical protein
MSSTVRNAFNAAKAIQSDIDKQLGPPEEGVRAETQRVLPFSIVRGTRGYIEKIVNQINGCYEKGWYDACAVMIRRVLETLIIESFEHHGLTVKIKNSSGDFFYLRDLIDASLNEPTWNLSRGCKQAMPKLKDVGDKSAHSRRYVAHRGDIDPLTGEIRLVVQELVYLAGLK